MDDTRQNYPHTWLLMTLTEGKFHQVRKMAFAVNHKCLRLIRISIENLMLGDAGPGTVKEFQEKDFFEKLGIEYES
jgi:23S rRNA pseudouridine2457 synthase